MATEKRRAMRIRANMQGTNERPRLSVDRSNSGMYAQVIDDTKGKTLFGMSLKSLEKAPSASSGQAKVTKSEKARMLGMKVAEEAKKHKVTKVVFDKGAYKYHGRVKSFAEGAREGGLDF